MQRHIVIIVENFSVPRDRRVWQESLALSEAGYKVSVICPVGGDHRDSEFETVIDGVRILRYPMRPATGGPIGYVREYSLALWHTLRLALKLRREGRVDVIQACNPPDILFLIALVLRPMGTRFVFDHHDLSPELFLSRFPRGGKFLYALTRFMERLTFATADAVISTNESYRRVAIERGKVSADRVTVVRNGPDETRFQLQAPDPSLRRGKKYLLAYLGVMGHADGIDYALRVIQLLRTTYGREDVHCILMGGGDAYDDMVALSSQLGISDIVEFAGWVGDDYIRRVLSTADICLAPDPRTEFSNLSTMIKVAEYMAMGRPIVSFDLEETKITADTAAVYVSNNDEQAFAEAVNSLLDDPDRRKTMGETGIRRVREELSWDISSKALAGFYEQFFERHGS